MPRLTERQKQSRRAKKIKARQQWQHGLWRKLRSVALLLLIGLAGIITYGFVSGKAQIHIANTMESMHQTIASTGLAVEHIDMTGRRRTGMQEIRDAINVPLGTSILAVDLDDIREELENIPTIKHASIERHFPDRISIHLAERKPVAIWQHKGKLHLVDELGTVMSDLSLHRYHNLPLLIGKSAPTQVEQALAIIAAEPSLREHIQSLTRVSNRRWNIQLTQGITIKLPEEGYMTSLQKLAEMHGQQQLLLRHIEAIDMRNTQRMYISVAPEKKKPKRPTHDT